MVLDVNQFPTPGQQYTFTFDTGLYRPSQDTILSELQGIPFMSQVAVARGDIFSNQIDVTFIYSGDGSDAIGSIAGYIMQAVGNWYTTFDFVSATTGPQGVQPAASDTGVSGAVSQAASAVGLSTGKIALLVVGIVAVAFIMSGGPSIVRGVTGK